jgi:hypothetical protein
MNTGNGSARPASKPLPSLMVNALVYNEHSHTTCLLYTGTFLTFFQGRTLLKNFSFDRVVNLEIQAYQEGSGRCPLQVGQ